MKVLFTCLLNCRHCRVSKQSVHGNEPFSWWNTILKWTVVFFSFGVVFLAFLLHCWCNTHLRCLPNYLCDLVLSSLATTEPSRNWTCLKAGHTVARAHQTEVVCLFVCSKWRAGGSIWKDLPAHGLVNRGAILGSVVHTQTTLETLISLPRRATRARLAYRLFAQFWHQNYCGRLR